MSKQFVYRKMYNEDVKCYGCLWETSTLYSFDPDDHDEDGLCAGCFMDMLVEMPAGELQEVCSNFIFDMFSSEGYSSIPSRSFISSLEDFLQKNKELDKEGEK